jgi:excisionase family DNA binding protein
MAVTIDNRNYYDIHEVAELFHCSTRTLKRYLDAGKLEGQKLGRTWYFTEDGINRYFTERGAGGNGEK